jgi:hypothetical protein
VRVRGEYVKRVQLDMSQQCKYMPQSSGKRKQEHPQIIQSNRTMGVMQNAKTWLEVEWDLMKRYYATLRKSERTN